MNIWYVCILYELCWCAYSFPNIWVNIALFISSMLWGWYTFFLSYTVNTSMDFWVKNKTNTAVILMKWVFFTTGTSSLHAIMCCTDFMPCPGTHWQHGQGHHHAWWYRTILLDTTTVSHLVVKEEWKLASEPVKSYHASKIQTIIM